VNILFNIFKYLSPFSAILKFLVEIKVLNIAILLFFSSINLSQYTKIIELENIFILNAAYFITYVITQDRNERVRYTTFRGLRPIAVRSLVVSLIFLLLLSGSLSALVIAHILSFSLFLINLNALILLSIRQFVRLVEAGNKRNVLVYGVGANAVTTANALTFSKTFHVKGFLAPEDPMDIKSLSGLRVYKRHELADLRIKTDTDLIIIENNSDFSLKNEHTLQIANEFGFCFLELPSAEKSIHNEVKLKAIDMENLLGRRHSIQSRENLSGALTGKVILITGAGGSIGGELARQIIQSNPKHLILLDHSEVSLYQCEEKLRWDEDRTKVSFVLASVTDKKQLYSIFEKHNIDIVYHAAAYKHVPIVERNIISGVRNNVLGTWYVSELSARFNVEKFILISTDKAVRSTNVMGATKRLCELICLSCYSASQTTFAAVRFGNVLGSSGSVVPKFKEQIALGGPVTVTHPEVTRYFMTIDEAVHLVLAASTLAKAGNLFLIDMGSSVKILSLAETLIRAHGLKPIINPKSHINLAFNEVAVCFTGLRPGEKLFEELLISGKAADTKIEGVYLASEPTVAFENVDDFLRKIREMLDLNDPAKIRNALRSLPLHYSEAQSNAESELIYHDPSMKQVTIQNSVSTYEVEQKIPSSGQKLKRIYFKILHTYFWLTRGVTLGARVAIFNKDHKVLLLKHTYITGWYLPGGGVEPGERIQDTAAREVFEETGLKNIKLSDQYEIYHNKCVSKSDYVALFHAKTDEVPECKSRLEIAEVRFFQIDELPVDIDPAVKELLPRLYTRLNKTNYFEKQLDAV
jgi:FlaA1/EpsC-like NDP-sugar epimerase/8-oxo-dGTP pyrophosphatase MutT (NUDIX family)